MTPCITMKPRLECSQCARYRPDMPQDPERRGRTVCIDGAAVRRQQCVFHVPLLRARVLEAA